MDNISRYDPSFPPKFGMVSTHIDFPKKINGLRLPLPEGTWRTYCFTQIVNNSPEGERRELAMTNRTRMFLLIAAIVLTIIAGSVLAPGAAEAADVCANTVTADVVVFDTPIMFNRLGPQNPN